MQGEVSALIQLIEDPDEEIFAQVRTELTRYGEALIPQLEHYWEYNVYGPLFNKRIESLILELNHKAVYKRLREWKESPEQDLLEALLILNRVNHPSVKEQELKAQVLKIRQDIWLELNDFLTAIEAVNVFNTILFKVYALEGVTHVSQGHNTLGELLNTRRGEPLIVGALYSWLAESLEINMRAINVPGDCLLAYQEDDLEGDIETLFYVHPHEQGAILSREDIIDLLHEKQYPLDERFFHNCTKEEWVGRMINLLINQAIALKDNNKVSELRALQSLMME
jgi:regulator of sirC expression with transglutaminase-like and TPR domain